MITLMTFDSLADIDYVLINPVGVRQKMLN